MAKAISAITATTTLNPRGVMLAYRALRADGRLTGVPSTMAQALYLARELEREYPANA